jgi:SAM-dependent methyltransferase
VEREYFEDMYASSPDPWGFENRWYEKRKYALTLAALSRPRYASAFEPGCSIGVLTAQLAQRCDHLLASDLIPSAVTQARQRVADLPHVEVRQWDAHLAWPDERFDLVLVSEMLFFLDSDDAERFAKEAAIHLTHDGEMLLVHWRPRVREFPLSSDQAHDIARAATGLMQQCHYEDDDFILDLLVPEGRQSVASREGLREEQLAPIDASRPG